MQDLVLPSPRTHQHSVQLLLKNHPKDLVPDDLLLDQCKDWTKELFLIEDTSKTMFVVEATDGGGPKAWRKSRGQVAVAYEIPRQFVATVIYHTHQPDTLAVKGAIPPKSAQSSAHAHR